MLSRTPMRIIACMKVNVVEVLVCMPAVRVFSGSALTFCFGLASTFYAFDGVLFVYFFKTFRVWVDV